MKPHAVLSGVVPCFCMILSCTRHYSERDDPSRTPEYEQYEQDSGYNGGYSWGSRRYSEHYSCGRDDAEGTSPHMVLLLRGTLTLPEWSASERAGRALRCCTQLLPSPYL